MAGISAKSGPSFLNPDEGSFELGLYQQGDPLGRGAFGSVYKYERKDKNEGNELHPRYIAVKEVMMLDDQEERRKLVRREYYNMKHSHQNIVSYLGIAIESKMAYFVMELCKADLRAFRKGRILIKPEVSVIMKQVLMALDYLHKRKIIHRDVKPQNVLVKTTHNQVDLKTVHVSELTMKLCDFGFARNVHSVSQAMSLSTVGTLEYVPPEARDDFEKRKPTSHYSVSFDTYSAGVVTHELSMGKLERDIETYTNTIELKTSLGHDTDSVLEDFLKSMLNQDKDRRKSPEELLNHPFIKLGEDFLLDCYKNSEQQIKTEERIEDLKSQLLNVISDLDIQKSMLAKSEIIVQEYKARNTELTQRVRDHEQMIEKLLEEIAIQEKNHEKVANDLKEEVSHLKEQLSVAKVNPTSIATTALRQHVSQTLKVDARSKAEAAAKPKKLQKLPNKITRSIPNDSSTYEGAKGQINDQLWISSGNGDIESMNEALRQGAELEYVRNHKTSLHVAASIGYIPVLNLLLNQGADVNSVSEYDKLTPLMFASKNNHHLVVELLLQHGASANMESKGRLTSLHLAALYGNLSSVKKLIDVGNADVNAIDANGKTPLTVAEERHLQGKCEDYNAVINLLKENQQ